VSESNIGTHAPGVPSFAVSATRACSKINV